MMNWKLVLRRFLFILFLYLITVPVMDKIMDGDVTFKWYAVPIIFVASIVLEYIEEERK